MSNDHPGYGDPGVNIPGVQSEGSGRVPSPLQQQVDYGDTTHKTSGPKAGDIFVNRQTGALEVCFTDGTWTTVGASSMKAPYVITPASSFSIGTEMAAHAFAAPASATWPTSNKAIYIPFWIPESVTLTQLFWYNGATVSGNIDVGVYAEDGTKKISAGSTAQATINVIQSVNVADTALTAGRYYLAAAMDNTTGTLFCWASTAQLSKSFGLAEQTSAFALPATATLATITTTRLPLVGFTIRTIV